MSSITSTQRPWLTRAFVTPTHCFCLPLYHYLDDGWLSLSLGGGGLLLSLFGGGFVGGGVDCVGQLALPSITDPSGHVLVVGGVNGCCVSVHDGSFGFVLQSFSHQL
jgi:hypothetical protein